MDSTRATLPASGAQTRLPRVRGRVNTKKRPMPALESCVGCPHCGGPVDISKQRARAAEAVGLEVRAMLACGIELKAMRERIDQIIGEAQLEQLVAEPADE